MNDNEELISEEFVPKVYKVLAEAMLAALENGQMLVEESKYSSQFIIDKMPEIKTKSELIVFLDELSSRWSAYADAVNVLKNEMIDTQKLQDVEEKLDEMSNQ